jgi:hypothetical protein
VFSPVHAVASASTPGASTSGASTSGDSARENGDRWWVAAAPVPDVLTTPPHTSSAVVAMATDRGRIFTATPDLRWGRPDRQAEGPSCERPPLVPTKAESYQCRSQAA